MPKASEKKRLAKQESTDKERSPYEVQFLLTQLFGGWIFSVSPNERLNG